MDNIKNSGIAGVDGKRYVGTQALAEMQAFFLAKMKAIIWNIWKTRGEMRLLE